MSNFITSRSTRETEALGRKFALSLKGEDVIILEGRLGTGKTVFAKGLARGLGYRGQVLSPTFTLVREYKAGKINIYHIDLYRLKERDLISLGLEDCLYDKAGITLIEWGEKMENYLDKYLKIQFSLLKQDERRLAISCRGYGKNKLKKWGL